MRVTMCCVSVHLVFLDFGHLMKCNNHSCPVSFFRHFCWICRWRLRIDGRALLYTCEIVLTYQTTSHLLSGIYLERTATYSC